MPFCPKCGTEYQEGTKFCGGCGSSLDGSVAPVPVAADKKPGFFQKLMDTKDYTDTMEAADIATGKVMTILCYSAVGALILLNWCTVQWFGILAAVGLLVAPFLKARSSSYVAFHFGQSVMLLLATLIVMALENAVAGGLLALIIDVIVRTTFNSVMASAVGIVISIIVHIIFSCVPVFVLIVGFINASKGKAKELPLLDKLGMEIRIKD